MNANSDTQLRTVSAKENPFVVQRTDSIPFDFRDTPFATMDEFVGHAKTTGFRGAIVGKHGRGKTTLLCGLHSHLKSVGQRDCELFFIPRDRLQQGAALRELADRGREGAIVLVDGLERVPYVARQRLISTSKQFSGFIATTHSRSRLKTLVRCRTSPEVLAAILDSLGAVDEQLKIRAFSLWTTHRGNVRSVLRDLYDLRAEGAV